MLLQIFIKNRQKNEKNLFIGDYNILNSFKWV